MRDNYEGKDFIENFKTRSHNNGIISMKRDFSLQGMCLVAKFGNCLRSELTFDTKSCGEFIENISYEIKIGNDILEEINELAKVSINPEQEVPQELREIRESIEQKLQEQKKYLEKLERFLEKTKSLPEYKKDVKKHEKEILETLSIL